MNGLDQKFRVINRATGVHPVLTYSVAKTVRCLPPDDDDDLVLVGTVTFIAGVGIAPFSGKSVLGYVHRTQNLI